MENQIENSSCAPSAKSLIVLIGIVFGALIAFTANETFMSIIAGAVIGLIVAIFFNSVIYPQKTHDR